MPVLAWDPPSEYKGEYGQAWTDERIKPPPAPITHKAYTGIPLGFTPVQPPIQPPPGTNITIRPEIKPPTVTEPASTPPADQVAPQTPPTGSPGTGKISPGKPLTPPGHISPAPVPIPAPVPPPVPVPAPAPVPTPVLPHIPPGNPDNIKDKTPKGQIKNLNMRIIAPKLAYSAIVSPDVTSAP